MILPYKINGSLWIETKKYKKACPNVFEQAVCTRTINEGLIFTSIISSPYKAASMLPYNNNHRKW